jgi:hypothetical protein
MEMARTWCREHPEACPRGWNREPPPLPLQLDKPGNDAC